MRSCGAADDEASGRVSLQGAEVTSNALQASKVAVEDCGSDLAHALHGELSESWIRCSPRRIVHQSASARKERRPPGKLWLSRSDPRAMRAPDADKDKAQDTTGLVQCGMQGNGAAHGVTYPHGRIEAHCTHECRNVLDVVLNTIPPDAIGLAMAGQVHGEDAVIADAANLRGPVEMMAASTVDQKHRRPVEVLASTGEIVQIGSRRHADLIKSKTSCSGAAARIRRIVASAADQLVRGEAGDEASVQAAHDSGGWRRRRLKLLQALRRLARERNEDRHLGAPSDRRTQIQDTVDQLGALAQVDQAKAGALVVDFATALTSKPTPSSSTSRTAIPARYGAQPDPDVGCTGMLASIAHGLFDDVEQQSLLAGLQLSSQLLVHLHDHVLSEGIPHLLGRWNGQQPPGPGTQG